MADDRRRGHQRALIAGLALLVAVLTFIIRVRGVTTNFWLMGDQIRDWRIALGPFSELPLVGPATHVGGYTVGPAFYWILWFIRITFGPFFENLPHAGGIGQSALSSCVDALFLVAVWRKTGSLWAALASTILVATGGFDLSLVPVLWNPVTGSILAKASTALILLDWHRGSMARRIITAAVAWAAVHAYTGAIYVTVAVFAALLLDPLFRKDWRTVRSNAIVIAAVVAALQVPYVLHQIAGRFGDRAMAAVTSSLSQVLTGQTPPAVEKSVTGYLAAMNYIQVRPWNLSYLGWLLIGCGVLVAIRFRRDPGTLLITLLPPVLTIIGYAIFLGALDHYYYLSLASSAVLIVVLGLTAIPPRMISEAIGIALVIGALILVPGRMRFAATDNRMPEYGAIVEGARTVARRGTPMRGVKTEFALRPTVDPVFVYRILGGQIDPRSRWIAVIAANGTVRYQDMGGA